MTLEERFVAVGTSGVKFRGVPFWSWNDELETGELARQIAEMADVGLGGHFMHARPGLITPYFGPEWMDCIKASVEASKKHGLKAWLYDENRWPSGCAGGAISAMGDEYVGKQLQWEVAAPAGFKANGSTVATFLIKEDNDGQVEYRRIDPKQCSRRSKEAKEVLHFFSANVNKGHQGQYVDVFNPQVIKEFIKHTYQGYHKAVGKEFGKTIPGIFTDEPQFAAPSPWSPVLPEAFEKAHGYDLIESLPMLVFEVGDYQAFRYDFWRTCAELFLSAYTRQIGAWCEKHKLPLTGHLNVEDSLRQVRCSGSVMPHYEHMQIPGIDHLCRRLGTHLLCKQVSSMAHQFGGRRVLSEMFGCCGWNVSFEELRWIAAYQFALGRDYPPSLHHQQPWWGDYRMLNDYFARVTLMLTQGKHVADILVLHNVESAWTELKPSDITRADALSDHLESLCKTLMGIHSDFDLGDESVLAEHGAVSKGQLKVRSCTYPVVIVPRCITLRSSTLALLQRLMDKGGTVLLAGDPPTRLDGRVSEKPAEVLKDAVRVVPEAAALKKALAKVLAPHIEVLSGNRDAASVYVQQRDCKTQQVFFLTNIDREKAVNAVVRLPGAGRLESWDPATGSVEPVRTLKKGKCCQAELPLEAMGCALLVYHPRKKSVPVRVHKPQHVKTIKLQEAWLVSRTEPNALTVDNCSYRIGTSEWSPRMSVLRVQKELDAIRGSEVCEFKYVFAADFHEKIPHDLSLVIEDPEHYEMMVNGLPMGTGNGEPKCDEGWWRDIAFRRFNIADKLRPQALNEVVLRRVIDGKNARKELSQQLESRPLEQNRLEFGNEIESLYIIGQFLVRSGKNFEPLERRASRTLGGFTLVDDWHQAETGDLVPQGLPFYAGTVRLSQMIIVSPRVLASAKQAVYSFDPPDAIVARVWVNGRDVGVRSWRPYAYDVLKHLLPGRNEIAVELTNSCRNLLGPHHHIDGELHAVSPGSFTESKSWTDRPDIPDCVWTDAYSFTRFGMVEPGKLVFTK